MNIPDNIRLGILDYADRYKFNNQVCADILRHLEELKQENPPNVWVFLNEGIEVKNGKVNLTKDQKKRWNELVGAKIPETIEDLENEQEKFLKQFKPRKL
jgi:hypothetical protein